MPITSNGRSQTGGKYSLDIEGNETGWIKEIDGGHAVAEVVTEKIGPDHLAHKHIGTVKYEEITFKCGTGMTRGIYDWINVAFKHTFDQGGRKSGAIIYADYNNKETSRLTFHHAIMTEYTMPALDANSKEAAMMTVKIKPETTRKTIGPGKDLKLVADAAMQKQWTTANFRLFGMGGALDAGLTLANKVDALTIKQKVVEDAVGQVRDYETVPANVEIPNLVVTISEAKAEAFYQWHEEFVIKGNCGNDMEKQLHLEYLTPNLKKVLLRLDFTGLGIFKIAPDKVEAGAEGIRRVKIEMYCENITIDTKTGAFFA